MNDSQTPTSPDTPDQPNPQTEPPILQEASFGQRVNATLIDIAVGMALSFVPLIGPLIALAYVALRDSLPFLEGQSIGKKVINLRAVTESGKPLTGNYNEGVIRNIVLIIPFFPLVELFILWTKNGKSEPLLRLGDEWAKTRVITTQPNPGDTTAT